MEAWMKTLDYLRVHVVSELPDSKNSLSLVG